MQKILYMQIKNAFLQKKEPRRALFSDLDVILLHPLPLNRVHLIVMQDIHIAVTNQFLRRVGRIGIDSRHLGRFIHLIYRPQDDSVLQRAFLHLPSDELKALDTRSERYLPGLGFHVIQRSVFLLIGHIHRLFLKMQTGCHTATAW